MRRYRVAENQVLIESTHVMRMPLQKRLLSSRVDGFAKHKYDARVNPIPQSCSCKCHNETDEEQVKVNEQSEGCLLRVNALLIRNGGLP